MKFIFIKGRNINRYLNLANIAWVNIQTYDQQGIPNKIEVLFSGKDFAVVLIGTKECKQFLDLLEEAMAEQ